jgi:hypothetical protein
VAVLVVHATDQDAEHAAEIAELHETRGDGVEQADAHEHHEQQLSPEEIAGGAE